MSETLVLEAEPREKTGKGPARRLRMAGRVPAVIYGSGEPEMMISLAFNEVRRELSRNPHFFSSLVELKVGRKRVRAIPREAQTHVVKDEPLHLDFLRVKAGQTVTVQIPVNFINEDACPGIDKGGVLNVVRYEVEMVCPVETIPGELTVDLTGFEVGDSIHISQVTLPAGVVPTVEDRDFTIASITAPTLTPADEEEAEAAEEAEGEEAEGEAEADRSEEGGESEAEKDE